jgi:hypothetical protein
MLGNCDRFKNDTVQTTGISKYFLPHLALGNHLCFLSLAWMLLGAEKLTLDSY